MIILTGAAGFIGSCLLSYLNNKRIENIIIADDFTNPQKEKNLVGKKYIAKIHRNQLFDLIEKNHADIKFVFHIGARTDTTEFNYAVFEELNIGYSKKIWNLCTLHQIPLIYASSAATYGLGELGFNDEHAVIEKLKPLNPYGESKNEFDKWVLSQNITPPFWAGLKFFNVFGPNEYHKGRMASVVFHAFHQFQKEGKIKLFKSHRPDYKDGMQLRDFIYVKDVIDICFYLFSRQNTSGIYNVGTGKARSFLDLAYAIFASLKTEPNIEFIDTPADIRDKYQYFTEANMQKLRSLGYKNNFFTLEKAVDEYIQSYLLTNNYY